MSKRAQQQCAALTRMTGGALLDRLPWALAALVTGCLMAGVITGLPPWFMVAGFLALIAWSARQTTPHLKNAARGLASALRSNDQVQIDVDTSGDSDSYQALARGQSGRLWRFTFIPQGWQPHAGEHPAELCYLPDVDWPVLICCQDGILYPRQTPAPQ